MDRKHNSLILRIIAGAVLFLSFSGILYINNIFPNKNTDKKVNSGAKSGTEANEGHEIIGNVDCWLTTTNQANLLSPQAPILPGEEIPADGNGIMRTITVNPDATYQMMDGFGASFTDASAWLVYNELDEPSRKDLMTKLFSYEDGIGISFLRQPMGASDFAHRLYTYDDVPAGTEDYELEHFSIEHDRQYIIPCIKDALELNPMLKVMASPWSPPAWMKTSGHLIGGSLRKEAYDAYARYFVKFIKAYEEEGIPIYAVTPQNEPLYVPTEYTGMKMEPYAQAEFINNHLGPEFEKNGLNTKILVYDHNWDNVTYAMEVLQKAGKYVAGSAWHCYGGSHDAMSVVYKKFPDKGIWFTEASGGQWVPPFNDAFADQMMHVIRSTRNYSKTVAWWNIALDQNNGPTVLKNSICRGIVTIDTSTGEVTYNVDYYTLGHISKFVKPGAYRIDSDNYMNDVESVAFKNPDGSIVLIVSNRTTKDKTLDVKYGNSSFSYKLPGKAAATFKWKGE